MLGHRAKAKRPPAAVEAFEVIVDQTAFGTGPEPAHGAQVQAHQFVCAPTAAPEGIHIFSS